MNYSNLKIDDKGEAVEGLQRLLNKVGALLKVDGDFGAEAERGVKYAQEVKGEEATGIPTSELCSWLEAQPAPFEKLSTEGVTFIASYEVSSLQYYDKNTKMPHYPGVKSGITIGVGYDLQFYEKEDFIKSWGEHLSREVIQELSLDIGKKRSEEDSKKRIQDLKGKGVEIPFYAAWSVFVKKTLPTFYSKAEGIYPSLAKLPDLCRSALVSLVYNRGTSLNGDRRREMKAIQDILKEAEQGWLAPSEKVDILKKVAGQFVGMKRIWENQGADGLLLRRDAEALLWEKGLEAWRKKNLPEWMG